MTNAAAPLKRLTRDLLKQGAALAQAAVPEVASGAEAADLVALTVSVDAYVRTSPQLAQTSLQRLIAVASDLYGRVPFGHAASTQALTLVASAEGLGHALRSRELIAAPLRRVPPAPPAPAAPDADLPARAARGDRRPRGASRMAIDQSGSTLP